MRATLGRLLFSGDDAAKPVRVLSGGEQGRMLFGKLMLQRPNVLLMDEPTNHMDMESIESLNLALESYAGHADFRVATTASSSRRWPPRSSNSAAGRSRSFRRATTRTTWPSRGIV